MWPKTNQDTTFQSVNIDNYRISSFKFKGSVCKI